MVAAMVVDVAVFRLRRAVAEMAPTIAAALQIVSVPHEDAAEERICVANVGSGGDATAGVPTFWNLGADAAKNSVETGICIRSAIAEDDNLTHWLGIAVIRLLL